MLTDPDLVERYPHAAALNYLLDLPRLTRRLPCHDWRNGCTCGACPGKHTPAVKAA